MATFTGQGDNTNTFGVVKLPKPLQDFIDFPSAQGDRNEALKRACLQARDIGWTQPESEGRLLPLGADRDGQPVRDVLATIRSIYSKPARDVPHGTRAGTGLPADYRTPRAKPKEEAPVATFEIEEDFKLPEPIASPAIAVLEALYQAGEQVFFSSAKYDPANGDDKETFDAMAEPQIWQRDALLKVLREKTAGSLDRLFDTKRGLYFALNPLLKTAKRRKADEIADFRYGLIEFDHISKEEQFQVLVKSKLPLAMILDSGRASIHGVVRIEAGRDAELYRSRMEAIVQHLRAYRPDPNTKDVARLSRFPGVHRADSGGEQRLLSLAVGSATYEDWEREIIVEQDGLPAIEDVFDLLADIDSGKLIEPAEVIVGVAHESCKLVLGGGSKTRKTWVLADLAVSVMSGGKWFGRLQCNKGAVLYLNMELPRYFMAKRVQAIAAAKGIKIEHGMFKVMNLRGFAASLNVLRPKLEAAIDGIDIKLIILDPTYKLMPGGDENGTQDSSMLLNEIERLAVKSGALCAFASHYSKGGQAHKNAQDRISGSGVFTRDPDTIITMTEHVEDLALSVDFILRNHPPQDSFVISWEHPLFEVNPDLNPADLKQEERPGTKKKEATATFSAGVSMNPAQLAGLKDYLAKNPEGSKNKLVDAVADIWEADPKTAKMKILPKLVATGVLSEIDTGIKRGLHTTKKYTFNDTPVTPETPSEPDETDEPF